MIDDMVPSVRDTIGVSAGYDETTIKPGIRRAITFMLRTWNFPKALIQATIPVADGDKVVALPASGVGKIAQVRIAKDNSYKVLRRTTVGELPRSDGPVYYWQEGNTIHLDTAISGTDYSAEVWYMNTSATDNEAWITEDFEDIVFTLSVMRIAQDLRKPEVHAAFAATWQEQVPTLAQYLNELEFSDMDIRLIARSAAPQERYPAQ